MQGKKVRQAKLYYGFNLEQAVPPDDFYRKLERAVDLGWVGGRVARCYSDIGRPSIDPEVIVKIELIGYLEGITSERQLLREISDRLSLRRYLGYDIDESLPDHSTLSRARDLLGRDLFQEVFHYSVRLCQAAGMVGGVHLSGDRSLIQANAALDSLEPRLVLQSPEQFLERLYSDNPLPPGESAPAPLSDLKERPAYPTQLPARVSAEATLGSASPVPPDATKPSPAPGARGKATTKAKPKQAKTPPSNASHLSRSDPEAKIASRPGQATMLAYSAEVWTDARQGVITYADVALATSAEHETALAAVLTQRQTLGLPVAQVGADKGYGQGRLYGQLERAGIVGYIPHKADNTGGVFGPQDFVYCPERGLYRCPNGCELTYAGLKVEWPRLRHVWRARRQDCGGCRLRARCTRARGGRELKLSHYQPYYQAMDRRLAGPGARLAAIARRVGPEPRFAQAKRWQGMARAKYRGRLKVKGQVLLTAAAQNLKKYVKWTWKQLSGAGQAKADYLTQSLCWLPKALQPPAYQTIPLLTYP